jgi:hypothetical protein
MKEGSGKGASFFGGVLSGGSFLGIQKDREEGSEDGYVCSPETLRDI